MKTFADRIQHLLKKSGINQIDLCRATGIPQPTLSRYKKDPLRTPLSSNAVRIAEYFQCDLRWLITGEGLDQSAAIVQPAPDLAAFSGRLLHLIQINAVTQQQVADACGMTHVGIGRICRNPKAECQASTALKLSRFFECDLVWLIAGPEASQALPVAKQSKDRTDNLAEIATQTEA